MPFDGQSTVTTIRTPVADDVKVTKVLPEKPVMPKFPPRRNRCRLDLRPVIWSLYNQPNDWVLERGVLHHTKSSHHFNARHFMTYGEIVHAPCNCGTALRHPTLRDRFAFHRAFKVWKRDHHFTNIQQQFAGHFVH